jgi:methionyl-tRNA synthetase
VSYYVTTPIYYVNAEPHLGHAYSTIAADILARHMRQRGEDVFFLTGTDEHGEPVAQAAEKLGLEPHELADRNAPRFKELMPRINVSNDFFIRTTDPEHQAKVKEVVQRVHDNGHVYEGTYEGWYCPRCADFKTESELGEGQTCPIHKIALHREREENWFFRLSSFQEPLERLYAERPDFVRPAGRRNEALSFIEGGLEDVSLSRPKLTWGVELPWDPGQVIYVWFDALLNYVTALSYAREGEDLTERFWPAFHIIGKDILKFHAVYWPAFLLAAGYEVPRRMFIHGYLLMEGHKMSKSLGNVLDPFEAIDRFGADALRYYCFREVSFGRDGSVSAAGFEARYETELANDYGNLASRTLAMIGRFRDGVVPEAAPDPALLEGADGLAGLEREVCELLDRAELTQALEAIWARVRRLNRYVEETRPWDLAKEEADPREPGRPRTQSGAGDRLDVVLYSLAEGLRVLALLLHAYMPETGDRLLEALAEEDRRLAAFGSRSGGQGLGELAPLFPKLELAAGEAGGDD